jgi:hypothetical protein
MDNAITLGRLCAARKQVSLIDRIGLPRLRHRPAGGVTEGPWATSWPAVLRHVAWPTRLRETGSAVAVGGAGAAIRSISDAARQLVLAVWRLTNLGSVSAELVLVRGRWPAR